MNHISLSLFSMLREGPKRTSPRHCEAAGCVQATREGKPFCSDHVDLHPYVQEILATLACKEDEEDRAITGRAKSIDVQGVTCREIIMHLKVHGARTEERLVREMNIDSRAMNKYIVALRNAGIVTTGYTKRGSTLVKLTNWIAERDPDAKPPSPTTKSRGKAKKKAGARAKKAAKPASDLIGVVDDAKAHKAKAQTRPAYDADCELIGVVDEPAPDPPAPTPAIAQSPAEPAQPAGMPSTATTPAPPPADKTDAA